jgi:hypothetical protein
MWKPYGLKTIPKSVSKLKYVGGFFANFANLEVFYKKFAQFF